MAKTAQSKNVTEEARASASAEHEASIQGEPSAEAIARRAYEIFLERGGAHGDDSDDWLQAELELRANTK